MVKTIPIFPPYPCGIRSTHRDNYLVCQLQIDSCNENHLGNVLPAVLCSDVERSLLPLQKEGERTKFQRGQVWGWKDRTEQHQKEALEEHSQLCPHSPPSLFQLRAKHTPTLKWSWVPRAEQNWFVPALAPALRGLSDNTSVWRRKLFGSIKIPEVTYRNVLFLVI